MAHGGMPHMTETRNQSLMTSYIGQKKIHLFRSNIFNMGTITGNYALDAGDGGQ